LIIREFENPRELVFTAFTDLDLYARWLGPRVLSMTLELFEPHAGGRWRYIHKDQVDNRFIFHGVYYHEVTIPERIIDTFEFEGLPEKGHAVLETANFKALAGDRTRLVTQAVFLSAADHDGQLEAD
jgi:uncharacterized protein YndB with AHSA1/START domain